MLSCRPTAGRVVPSRAAVRDAACALISEESEHFPFLFTVHEAVLILHGHKPGPSVQVGGMLLLGGARGRGRPSGADDGLGEVTVLFGFGHAGFLCGQGGRVDQFAEHMQVIELWVLR